MPARPRGPDRASCATARHRRLDPWTLPARGFEEATVVIEPGDLLVVFSDGVTEALSAAGEEFGDDRLQACLEAHRHRAPTELLDEVIAAVRAFTVNANQYDDLTALVLRYQ